MTNNIENEVERIVADLVERYKDPTQLNGTDYLFIPVDKIKHTLTSLTEQHKREKEELRQTLRDEKWKLISKIMNNLLESDVTNIYRNIISYRDRADTKLENLTNNHDN